MGVVDKRIQDRIANGEVNTKIKQVKPKKQSLLKRLALYPFEMIKIMLGIDQDSLHKTTATSNNSSYNNQENFRSRYRVDNSHNGLNPYTFDPVEYDNMRIYLQGQDGRGDPSCDCHDR